MSALGMRQRVDDPPLFSPASQVAATSGAGKDEAPPLLALHRPQFLLQRRVERALVELLPRGSALGGIVASLHVGLEVHLVNALGDDVGGLVAVVDPFLICRACRGFAGQRVGVFGAAARRVQRAVAIGRRGKTPRRAGIRAEALACASGEA